MHQRKTVSTERGPRTAPGPPVAPNRIESRVVQAILDTAVDGIVSIDARGIILSVNRATERIFGYPAAELVGQNVTILMPSPYREEHDGYLASYLATGKKKIIGIGREVVGRRRDGTTFPLDLAVAETRIDGQSIFTGILRDISARKEAERKLREQAELIDLSPDAIMVRDENERILFWSRGAEQLYGWTAAEVVGRDAREIMHADPQAADIVAAREAVVRDGAWHGMLRQRNKAGQDLEVESRWVVVPDDQGQGGRKLVINTNVTEKNRLEARLMRAQRLESIGTLAGGIAHDLNNVLTPVTVACQLLSMNRPGTDQAALLQMIQASAARGAEMIKQLLAFAGGAPGQRTPIRLSTVIDELRGILEHTLPKSIQVHIDVTAGPWAIVGDVTELTQVLMNLCVNARDAMPSGGLLSISAENVIIDRHRSVQYQELEPGPYVILSVADTGIGMSRELQERIFDPFFTTKEQGKGTGLGLATTLGIVRAHGGVINVYSEPGQGSRFQIYLPAIVAESRAMPESVAATSPAGGDHLVMIVDDEPLIRQTTKMALESFGFRVVAASGGEEALALFRQHRDEIAAVVLDMMMPGMDGAATLRALHEINATVPVIAASGLKTAAREAEVMSAGAVAFLQKPFSNDQLLHHLHEAIRKNS